MGGRERVIQQNGKEREREVQLQDHERGIRMEGIHRKVVEQDKERQ